jgi:photosystem II Psb27 protein
MSKLQQQQTFLSLWSLPTTVVQLGQSRRLQVLGSRLRAWCLLACVVLSLVVSLPSPAQAGLFGNRSEKVISTKELREKLNAGLTGKYSSDTQIVINTLRTALSTTDGAENRAQVQDNARYAMSAYISRYRSDSEANLYSYTTMRTAINTLAGYLNGTTRRVMPQKSKDRVLLELDRAETALAQGR